MASPAILFGYFFQVLVESSCGCNHVSGNVIQDQERGYTITDHGFLRKLQNDLLKMSSRLLLPMLQEAGQLQYNNTSASRRRVLWRIVRLKKSFTIN